MNKTTRDLVKKLEASDGLVVRLKDNYAWCGGPFFDYRNWAIVNFQNGELLHHFSISSDCIFGFSSANYFPKKYVSEKNFVNGDPWVIGTGLGICEITPLRCTPAQYDSWLSNVFEKVGMKNDFNQKQSVSMNKRGRNGEIVIKMDSAYSVYDIASDLPLLK